MNYFIIEPDVPGRLAPETHRVINSGALGQASEIHVILETWPCDDFGAASPVHIASDALVQRFRKEQCSGFELRKCKLSKDEQLLILDPQSPPLSKYHWLVWDGIGGQDDFGIVDVVDLVVSERVVNIIKLFRHEFCEFLAKHQD